jgi:4-hydroxybenzoate polyprenyltransferase
VDTDAWIRAPHYLRSRASGLIGAAHLGPALAVTLLAMTYGIAVDLEPAQVALVTGAVLAGQLSIGWGNDLVDADRDRAVGRRDKPLADGSLPLSTARVACGLAIVATVVLSLACGIEAGLVHIGCVAAGWAYNLGVKSTVFSWLPFAVAFGGLPVFVVLAGPGTLYPPWWVALATALLGVGAHLVNVLPDLADDEATGVRGLAHRLGARRTAKLAVATLSAATAVIALGANSIPVLLLAVVLTAVAALAAVAFVGRGRVPFQAAVGIAVVDVALLVLAG